MLILREGLLEEDSTYKYIDKTDRTKELNGRRQKIIMVKRWEKSEVERKLAAMQAQKRDRKEKIFFLRGIFILISKVLYTTMLHPPPLRFHCVGDRIPEDCCVGNWQSNALSTRLDIIYHYVQLKKLFKSYRAGVFIEELKRFNMKYNLFLTFYQLFNIVFTARNKYLSLVLGPSRGRGLSRKVSQ